MDILLHINYFNYRIKQIPQIKDSYKLVRKKPTQMKNICSQKRKWPTNLEIFRPVSERNIIKVMRYILYSSD